MDEMALVDQTDEDLADILEGLGFSGPHGCPDLLQNFRIQLEALKLYEVRNRQYGPVWKRYGALSNLLRAAAKTDRLIRLFWSGKTDRPTLHKDNLDDAFDLMNYVTFFIHNMRHGSLYGDR